MLAALIVGAAAAPARAADREALARWLAAADAALAAAQEARTPPKRPPVPVAVTWKPRRLASIDLRAPVLALVGGDLDGDKLAELYAVTEREVVAFAVGARGVTERARVELPGDQPAIRPRDGVATAYIERGVRPELRVRTSTRAKGARFVWDGKDLRATGPLDDFPACAGRVLALVPGRNFFGAMDAPVYAVRCREDVVAKDGTPLAVVGELAAGGQLAVTVSPRCTNCAPGVPVAVGAIGTAFEIVDLDRDGALEVVAAGAGAAGDRDAIKVLALGPSGPVKKPKFRKPFTGGVAALAVADVDGDGADEVIGAVRLPGSTRVDLWQLNR